MAMIPVHLDSATSETSCSDRPLMEWKWSESLDPSQQATTSLVSRASEPHAMIEVATADSKPINV